VIQRDPTMAKKNKKTAAKKSDDADPAKITVLADNLTKPGHSPEHSDKRKDSIGSRFDSDTTPLRRTSLPPI
jgi:hypothetical protein